MFLTRNRSGTGIDKRSNRPCRANIERVMRATTPLRPRATRATNPNARRESIRCNELRFFVACERGIVARQTHAETGGGAGLLHNARRDLTRIPSALFLSATEVSRFSPSEPETGETESSKECRELESRFRSRRRASSGGFSIAANRQRRQPRRLGPRSIAVRRRNPRTACWNFFHGSNIPPPRIPPETGRSETTCRNHRINPSQTLGVRLAAADCSSPPDRRPEPQNSVVIHVLATFS